ncbi:L-aspartate oxidase [Synechocystis sp. LKSZ1]|uniref:L-aspartate oxidase n=1 Tax=Synechocystis sp. LKSZ1 TaxID=3144951 RepID=UPI00336BF365
MAAQDFDVIIVGSGAAGLYASLCFPSTYRLAIITKAELKTGASDWAQGGIAAAIAPTDSPQLHYQDTLSAGAGLCEPDAVRFLVEKAPQAIQELVRLGVQFDRSGPDLALTLEAAHSRPRVLHAADTTGRAIVSTLMEQVLARPQVEIFPQAIAVSLDCDPATGQCRGVSVLHQDRLQWFRARVILLATGGGGQVFAQTTNPKVSTGDGIALAWRCGAILRDLEFFQFHPTALTKPGVPHFLISEAVRGEGAHLRDKAGRRFLFDYHPQGELAPRDVVSRAIFQHLQATATDPTQATVFLDLSTIEPERIRRRFPNIIERCQKWGVDVFQESIPVAPAAHYWMGGVQTDLACRTSVPGLWAIGEVTSTGVHGANRLASNSLLECIVFADQLALLDLPSLRPFPNLTSRQVTVDFETDRPQIQSIRQAIPSLMWQAAGICRHADSLRPAIAQVEQWQAQWQDLASSRFMAQIPPGQNLQFATSTVVSQLQYWAETRNLLDIAALILKSALFRPESRGGHFRLDYPQALPEWQLHTQVQQGQWSTQEIKS